MRKGRIRMSTQLLTDLLQFPDDWKIESMSFKAGDEYITAVMSGEDFPEETGIEGANIKNCRIEILKECVRFEVKEVN